ncbi:VGLL2 family protein [Megaselia abdita]
MAVSCPEVMYGAYYPYLYGRAGPSRSFYQYERFNQDLYSSSGVPLASSSASGSSHSPCSPILPSSVSNAAAVAAAAAAHNITSASSSSLVSQLPIGSNNSIHSRGITKEESDITTGRSDNEGLSGAHHHNDSSCSSGPDSPHHHGLVQQAKDHQHLVDGGSGGGAGDDGMLPRAQYISASCVVFTNYSGDTSTVVDEHFSRALNFSNKDSKESSSPMSARNFPPSFWNSNYVHPTPAPTHPQVADLYGADGGYSTDPWVPHAAHYGSYAHAAHAHAAHAHAYHHNMAQYGSLLRLPQQYGHSSRLHHEQQAAHALESAAAYSSYPTMAGLEAQVQESSKDLYWF